jgi:hypothetical protein
MSGQRGGLDPGDCLVHVIATVGAMVAAGASAVGPDSPVAVGLVAAVSTVSLAWRRSFAKAGSEALPRVDTGEAAALRLVELEQRVAELEHAQARTLEPEERLDFAERLLARPAGRHEER